MTSTKKQDTKPVILLDVAETAGVSRSTASLVVRNSPLVAVSKLLGTVFVFDVDAGSESDTLPWKSGA